MPINISFDSNLTQNEADALRVLLGTLRPAVGEQPNWEVVDGFPLTSSDSASTVTLCDEPYGEKQPIEMMGVGGPEVTISELTIPTAEVDLDSDGKEWDEALHASTRTKTADGRWKKKRGAGKVEDEQAAAEEIEAGPVLAGIPTPPAAAPVPPPPPAPTADSGLPTFPETVKICSALGKGVYEKVFTDMAVKSILDLRDDAVRTLFFENETILVARLEKGV